MTAKFTKGPWSVFGLSSPKFKICQITPIVSVYASEMPCESAFADANLIVCAPEMYEMLERLQTFCDEVTAENTTLYGEAKRLESAVDALLSKARGEI